MRLPRNINVLHPRLLSFSPLSFYPKNKHNEIYEALVSFTSESEQVDIEKNGELMSLLSSFISHYEKSENHLLEIN
jgi:hypothetical protein